MEIINGLAGASGYIMGEVFLVNNTKEKIVKKEITEAQVEIEKLQLARKNYRNQLQELYTRALEEVGENDAEIFLAYQEILADDIFFDQIIERVKNEKVNIEFAINEENENVIKMFSNIDDQYLKERATDVSNVCSELIDEIQNRRKNYDFKGTRSNNVIVVAHDLTPADTIKMDKSVLKGFVTEKGGVTSHTVILAKTLGIPAVVGVEKITEKVNTGLEMIVNGDKGEIIITPNEEQEKKYAQEKKLYEKRMTLFQRCKKEQAVTLDGTKVRVNINTGDKESLSYFDKDNCDGIGLFRTEFLYMNHSNYPTEEEQFEVYKNLALQTCGKEVIIRTLDIGGDKQIAYMDLPKEDNPFLGYRAIRLCLDRREVFKTQLKAILRASIYGNVKIMFPMIVNIEEVLLIKEILHEVETELKKSGIKFNKQVPMGIMIETPAAVLLSDILAKEVDFFSIGSNDLIQYTTATDRMNNRIQWLYDSCNLSVLKSIKMVCDNAKRNNIEVGICGEVASETELIPLWVAMGVDELSVVPSEVGKVKYIINHIDYSEVKKKMEEVLNFCTSKEVRKSLTTMVNGILN